MNKSLRSDFYVLLGIIFISIPTIIFFNVKPLTSALFLFIIPTIYLFLRKKKPVKELLLASLLIGNGLGLIFNIILSLNRAWDEFEHQLVFNYRVFGFMPADEPIWFFFWALIILTFYEHFYDRDGKDKLSKKFKYLALPTLMAVVLVVAVILIQKETLLFRYAYFWCALPTVIPIWYVIRYRQDLILKFIKTGAFFLMLFLIYELTAVKLGQWYFPGEYIGLVNIMGITFPFEELLFWMSISPFVVVAVYEGFVDDGK